MPLTVLNPQHRPMARDGIVYDSGRGYCRIPDSATAATLLPILYTSGLKLYAIPGQTSVVEARILKW